jgi:hypothetical protein
LLGKRFARPRGLNKYYAYVDELVAEAAAVVNSKGGTDKLMLPTAEAAFAKHNERASHRGIDVGAGLEGIDVGASLEGGAGTGNGCNNSTSHADNECAEVDVSVMRRVFGTRVLRHTREWQQEQLNDAVVLRLRTTEGIHLYVALPPPPPTPLSLFLSLPPLPFWLSVCVCLSLSMHPPIVKIVQFMFCIKGQELAR